MTDSYWSKLAGGRVSRRRALASAGGAALGAALLAACGGDDEGAKGPRDTSGLLFSPSDTTKQAQRGGIQVYAYSQEPLNYDPLSSSSQFTFGHAHHAYQRFFRLKAGTKEQPASGDPEGDAVERWELSGDSLQLTMKLRQNKLDPRPPTSSRVLTTEDVKWSWDRFLALQPGRLFFSNQLHPDAPIESVTYPDGSTVVMKLAFPASALLKMLGTIYYFAILPVEAEGKFDFRQDMRGSGAWMMTKYERGVGWEYRRNPNWNLVPDRPFLDGLDYALIADIPRAGPQALAQFTAKRLWYLSPNNDIILGLKRERPEVQMYSDSPFRGQGSQTYIGMSKLPTSAWEKDVRLRQALSMLVDREAYIDANQNVSGMRKEGLPMEFGIHTHVPCSWPRVWLDPASKDFGANAKFLGYDPAMGASVLTNPDRRREYNASEAAKLLRAAGAFGHQDTLTFAATEQFATERQLSILVQMWNEGGHFKIQLNPQDYTTVITPRYTFGKGQYPDLGTHPLGGWSDWDIGMWNTFTPSGRNDYVGHDTPHLKELMVRHRREFDVSKRIAIAHDWQREIAKEMVIVPFPGLATTFTLQWPWRGNGGWFETAGGGVAQQETTIHLWYDKSKDTRTG